MGRAILHLVSSALWGVQENSSWEGLSSRSPLLSFICSPPLALRRNGLWWGHSSTLHTHARTRTRARTVPVNQWFPEGD